METVEAFRELAVDWGQTKRLAQVKIQQAAGEMPTPIEIQSRIGNVERLLESTE